MDEFGVILLTVFMVLLACGVLHRPVRLTYIRVRDHCKYHPRASQFQDARRKLSTVSEYASASPEKQDVESGVNQPDAGPERPICIEPLFVPNNKTAAGPGPMQGMPSQISGEAAGVLSVQDSEGQAGPIQHTAEPASEDGNTKPAVSKGEGISIGRLWRKSPVKKYMKASDDDILTLKGCRHAFHARCLSSWFLIQRYDCPVCRNPYWLSREENARAAHARPEPRPGGRDGEPGIAGPAGPGLRLRLGKPERCRFGSVKAQHHVGFSIVW
ncbi:hypothetical protein LZ31DRAFT_335514 [Colletotrichum somersetense]|nr:hypothetical protein LZ31DRAFT_335514 [Colletotrichum somersetense]